MLDFGGSSMVGCQILTAIDSLLTLTITRLSRFENDGGKWEGWGELKDPKVVPLPTEQRYLRCWLKSLRISRRLPSYSVHHSSMRAR